MTRTQIQLPDELYRKLKHLAELQETSLADVLRRAGERELAAHPEIESAPSRWEPPAPRALGIKREIAVQDWRLLANDPSLVR
jgi:predicted transcriptional regulator